MKHIYFFLLFVSVSFLTTGQINNDSLIGRWKIAEINVIKADSTQQGVADFFKQEAKAVIFEGKSTGEMKMLTRANHYTMEESSFLLEEGKEGVFMRIKKPKPHKVTVKSEGDSLVMTSEFTEMKLTRPKEE